MKSFGSKGLQNCLLCLGFEPQKQVGTSHQKYNCPKKVEKGQHPFITVIHGKKSYDKVTMGRYITQIKHLGYTKKEIEDCLKK